MSTVHWQHVSVLWLLLIILATWSTLVACTTPGQGTTTTPSVKTNFADISTEDVSRRGSTSVECRTKSGQPCTSLTAEQSVSEPVTLRTTEVVNTRGQRCGEDAEKRLEHVTKLGGKVEDDWQHEARTDGEPQLHVFAAAGHPPDEAHTLHQYLAFSHQNPPFSSPPPSSSLSPVAALSGGSSGATRKLQQTHNEGAQEEAGDTNSRSAHSHQQIEAHEKKVDNVAGHESGDHQGGDGHHAEGAISSPPPAVVGLPPDLAVEPSSHTCYDLGNGSVPCLLTQVYLHNGDLLYVTEDDSANVSLPKVSGYRATFPGPAVRVVSVAEFKARFAAARDLLTVEFEEAALIHRAYHDNWFHTLLDVGPAAHATLCAYLGRCNYTPEDLDAATLVFYDAGPPSEYNFREHWECFSSQPFVYATSPEVRAQLLMLRRAVVGWVYRAAFEVNLCAEHLPYLASWHSRLQACVGVSPTDSVLDIDAGVTVVQRTYFESVKAKTFLNVQEVVREVRRAYPTVPVRLDSLRGLSMRDIAALFHDTSVIVAANGAALANVVFMRWGAVFIDVGAVENHPNWLHNIHRNLGSANVADIKAIRYTITEPAHVRVRWEEMVTRAGSVLHYLSGAELRYLLQHHTCPSDARDRCRDFSIYFNTDYVLTVEKMLRRVDEALQHLAYYNHANPMPVVLPKCRNVAPAAQVAR